MNNQSRSVAVRGIIDVLWVFVLPIIALFGVYGFICMVEVPIGVETLRGKFRSEVTSRLMQDEEKAFPKVGSADWVNREKGTARVAISESSEMILGALKSRLPKPSQVKVDPELLIPAEAPRMPSAPSGASTIRFKKLSPNPHAGGAPSVSNQG